MPLTLVRLPLSMSRQRGATAPRTAQYPNEAMPYATYSNGKRSTYPKAAGALRIFLRAPKLRVMTYYPVSPQEAETAEPTRSANLEVTLLDCHQYATDRANR